VIKAYKKRNRQVIATSRASKPAPATVVTRHYDSAPLKIEVIDNFSSVVLS